MALNINDESVHEVVRRIVRITGESQTQAVATAVRERLDRLQNDQLAERLITIGREAANRSNFEVNRLDDHFLFDDRGLPT